MKEQEAQEVKQTLEDIEERIRNIKKMNGLFMYSPGEFLRQPEELQELFWSEREKVNIQIYEQAQQDARKVLAEKGEEGTSPQLQRLATMDVYAYAQKSIREERATFPLLAAEYERNPDKYDLNDIDAFDALYAAVLANGNLANVTGSGATAEEAKKAPPLAKIPIRGGHIFINSAIINAIQANAHKNAEEFQVRTLPKNKKHPDIFSSAMIAYVPPDITDGPNKKPIKLSEFERQVTDAVATLFDKLTEAGMKPKMSINDIFLEMPGGGNRMTARQQKRINDTLTKFGYMRVWIDATDEMRERGKIDNDSLYLFKDAPYLAFEREVAVSRNGRVLKDSAITVYKEPPIYAHAKASGQVITRDRKMFDIREVDKDGKATNILVKMSEERMLITGYLARRVLIMKKDEKDATDRLRKQKKAAAKDKNIEVKTLSEYRNINRKINFSTLFSTTEISTKDRKQLMLYRTFVSQVLDYWKAIGEIKEYKITKAGRTIDGVIIEF